MGFFSLFKRKEKIAEVGGEPGHVTIGESIHQIQGQIVSLHSHLSEIDVTLKTHDGQLVEHATRLQSQGEKLHDLEQRILSAGAQAPRLAARQAMEGDRPAGPIETGRQFDINRFTEQERRILAVFFQNREKLMSYADIGSILGRSPHTMKNAVNHIRIKADIFERTVGNEGRNLFRLRGDLRVEKYLNVGQLDEPPQSTLVSDPSNSSQLVSPPQPLL